MNQRNIINLDQHYALNQDGKIVHISNAWRDAKFSCPCCGGEMVCKQGNIRKWHFAHKTLSDNCSYETYLHSLAKIRFCEWFNTSDEFIISLDILHRCSLSGSCIWFENEMPDCCENKSLQSYNLKKYYDSCDIERSFEDFRSDLLIYNSTKSDREPIFIEVCVTHPCSKEKINSGIRIIEFVIRSEEDIDFIIGSTIKESNIIRLYNFKVKSETTDTTEKGLRKFILYESYKGVADIGKVTCKNYTVRHSKSIFELTIEEDDLPMFYSLYELGLAAAYNHGYIAKSCYLCKWHENLYYEESPIFCRLYKKLGTVRNCKSTKAQECNAFRVDGELCKTIVSQSNDRRIDIWERSKALNTI